MKRFAVGLTLAVFTASLAFWFAGQKAPPATATTIPSPANPSLPTISVAEPASAKAVSPANSPTPSVARPAMSPLEEKDAQAARLAEQDTPEAVAELLRQLRLETDWQTRAVLGRNFRALGNPEVLQVLLPALLVDYGRGSPVTMEIIDAIGRLAQEDTVTALEALHWQASGNGVETMKVVRAMAAIRNPPARRALNKLAQNPQVAESLRIAAQEAAQAIPP